MLQFSVPRFRGTQLLKTLARPGAARLRRAVPVYSRGDPNSVLKNRQVRADWEFTIALDWFLLGQFE